MSKTRGELDDLLFGLEEQMPKLIEQYPPDSAEFFEAFAGRAEPIASAAGPGDVEYVRGKMSCILGSFGFIPSENEGESCTGATDESLPEIGDSTRDA